MQLVLRAFWRSTAGQRHLLGWYSLVSLGVCVLYVSEPLYGMWAINQLVHVADDPTVPVATLIGGWLGLYVLFSLGQSSQQWLRWRILRGVLTASREHAYAHLLRLDVATHVRSRTGELMKTIDNAADATHETTVHILAFPPTVLTSLAFFVLSFFVSWKLALIATAMVPFYLLLVTLYVRWTRRHWWRIQELWRTAMGRAYDASTNILTVKATGQEDAELARMQSLHQQSLSSLASVDFVWALFEGIGYFMILKILLITTGVLLLAHGEINLGQLFFFQFCFFRLVVPFEMLGSIAPRLSEKIAKIRAAEDLLALPISVQNPAHPKRLPALRGGLTLENVSFSYGDGEALKNLSLSIAPGEHLAVVGHSGAGKSTLASLLLRFYDPTSGAILIDGVDLRELDLGWWRQQVGLVLQENMTFHDTVLENIRYVKPGATLVEVQRAAEQAAAATFVAGLPQGYDTIVGERGIRLSGGERQRVAIARAMLQQPTLVVLDEPTSALDSLTERDVHQGLQALTHGRTSITIAHRLSTVQAADRIAVLAHGQLIACAPHAELLRTCDTYRRMVELQQSGLLADDSHQQ